MLAAYRDRYGITGGAPLGSEPVSSDVQAIDAARAATALHQATWTLIAQVRPPAVSHDERGIGV